MKKIWSSSDKPIKMTADERAREVFDLVMTFNEDLDKGNKISFECVAPADCIVVVKETEGEWKSFSWYQSDNEPDKKYAELIKTIREWHAEALITEIEKIYEEEENKNGKG